MKNFKQSKEIASEELISKYCEICIKKNFGFQAMGKEKRFEM